MERVDRVIKIGLAVAAVLYLAAGVILAIVHPRLSENEQLIARNTRHLCGSDNPVAIVLMWPVHAQYYYGGAFETCRSTL
jgi:hypothetical protein